MAACNNCNTLALMSRLASTEHRKNGLSGRGVILPPCYRQQNCVHKKTAGYCNCGFEPAHRIEAPRSPFRPAPPQPQLPYVALRCPALPGAPWAP